MESCIHGYLKITCPRCAGVSSRKPAAMVPQAAPSDTIDLKHDVIDKITERFARDARRKGPKPTYPAPTEE